MGAQLEKLVAKGKMAGDKRDAAVAALRVATDVRAACEGVDLVVEAAPESMELKVKLLGDVVAGRARRTRSSGRTRRRCR